ncbi:MAG: DegT/DnrJ/EryC1/StrS aminotransferase family protein, partial [Planctomycetaceae bacterium]|nr:DegT/DnrJ/EryC1/StrS aminotransferase family protein [Planctomycetaceae bacterium]
MWSRKRIDITWTSLFAACWSTFVPPGGSQAGRRAESALSETDAIACLSVRSGFDLLLTERQFPAGSEILMSAITIPDMPRIVASHGLVAVPVDICPSTMSVDCERIRSHITPETKAIVVAHLFGTIPDLDPVAALARQHNLLLIEDCAQALDGRRYPGHP